MKPRSTPPGLVQKFFAILLATVLLAVGFMFSVVLLAVVAVLGAIGLTYVWWKTRALRRAIRERMEASNHGQSMVIEGEATVVREAPGGGTPHLVRHC